MKQVTAAVIIEEGRLLIARRPPGDPLAGMWELPGGKVEPGETPAQCLARELAEELNMATAIGDVLARTVYHYDHGSFEMLALTATRLSGFELRFHDEFAWVPLPQLAEFPLAPADVELVQKVLLTWRGPGRASDPAQ